MTEPVLDQQSIDQLILDVRAGRIPAERGSLVRMHGVIPMDLGDPTWSQDRIIRRRLPVLDLVFDRLVPSLQVTLTKSLRFPVRAESMGVELKKFGDFRGLYSSKPCLFQVMRLDPLRGYSAMVLDTTVLYALVDSLMGGLGVAEQPGDREVSDIEASLLHRPHVDILRDFENAWKPWFPLRVEHVRSDRNVQVLSTIADEEVCHVGTIMVAGDVLPASPIHFVLPYSSLEPLLEATSARAGEEIDPNWRVHLEQNLRDSLANVAVVVGHAEVPTARMSSIAPGEIIELDRRIDEDLDVRVEGENVFKGRIGRSHQNYGVKISGWREIKRDVVDRSVGQILVRKGLISREQLAVVLVDELINRRPLLDSIVARGWVERMVLERALQ